MAGREAVSRPPRPAPETHRFRGGPSNASLPRGGHQSPLLNRSVAWKESAQWPWTTLSIGTTGFINKQRKTLTHLPSTRDALVSRRQVIHCTKPPSCWITGAGHPLAPHCWSRSSSSRSTPLNDGNRRTGRPRAALSAAGLSTFTRDHRGNSSPRCPSALPHLLPAERGVEFTGRHSSPWPSSSRIRKDT
jgi:hypothetical protein